MTKHSYLPTTLITDKGSAFTSKILEEITAILGFTLKCATTKHPQTIGKLERTHASSKTNLKMASGEYRRQWHKYLPLAVLNYNTTYHASIGCEPSKVFHGRIPYNVQDHKLGNNPNKNFLPTTEFAEELQQRTQILIDQTKRNIMQSYLKYKEYYDRKAKAAPLQEKDYCFVLQPKADSQGSKKPFRDFRWIGPFVVQKTLPNNNYIVRRLNTNKTQILHRIRLKKFVPNAPLEDKYEEEKLQPDEEIVIPQDDLYTISWEADFEYELFETRENDWPDTATRLPRDATNGEVDHYVTEKENSSANGDERSSAKNEDDVIKNEIRPNTATNCGTTSLQDETPKQSRDDTNVTEDEIRTQPATSRDTSSPLSETPRGTEKQNDVTNDLENAEIASKGGVDINVPGISENGKDEENSSPRGGKYNLRPNPTPNFTDEYRY